MTPHLAVIYNAKGSPALALTSAHDIWKAFFTGFSRAAPSPSSCIFCPILEFEKDDTERVA